MSKRRKVELDPAVASILDTGRGVSARKQKKRERDAKRVRLRLDIPEWLKDLVEQEAKNVDTSMSQLSAFFLAYALKLYRDGDPNLVESLKNSKTAIRAMNFGHGIDLSDLENALANSADTLPSLDLSDL